MPAATKLCTCISHSCGSATYIDEFGSVRHGVSVSKTSTAAHTPKDDQVKQLLKLTRPTVVGNASEPEAHQQPAVPPPCERAAGAVIGNVNNNSTSELQSCPPSSRLIYPAKRVILSMSTCFDPSILTSFLTTSLWNSKKELLAFPTRTISSSPFPRRTTTFRSLASKVQILQPVMPVTNTVASQTRGRWQLNYAAAENAALLSHEHWIAESLVRFMTSQRIARTWHMPKMPFRISFCENGIGWIG